ncbi:hypothetical protein ACJRO7_019617 [Eucalyptus globulus]|uniref:Neprosin PEP catalytic domain-containing protein n=1 Tax=Eucalyptus globulus TaxID=34317 RepID=A0ABD3KKI3_EUCGL
MLGTRTNIPLDPSKAIAFIANLSHIVLVRIARMESKVVMLLLFSLLCQQVKSSSSEDGLQIEEELRRLNKAAVKTIQTEYGDTYDCVDFYKQPAFDHPLLKNHSFHFDMRPSFRPKRRTNLEGSAANGIKSASIMRLDCPLGTVPIRRTSKEELIAARTQAKVHDPNADPNTDPNTEEAHGLRLAIVRTKFGSGKKYNGGGMVSSVEMPWAKGSQYSGGQIKIQSGPDFIQAGWMVNPSLYSHYQTHLFLFTKVNLGIAQFAFNTCFNAQCPGFVLVRSDHPMDAVLHNISKAPGPVYTYNYFIYRDPTSGLWWLELGEDYTAVGFWPRVIFSGGGLCDLATYVEWGGQVYSPPDIPSPHMGRSTMPLPNIMYDASCQDMTTINENHDTEAAGGTGV